MKFKYLALIAGGIGPDVWDNEITVEGEDMTIKQALEKVESDLDSDAQVVSIEQVE